MIDATIYCHCGHRQMLSAVKKAGYVPVGLGNDNFSEEFLRDNTLINISHKNRYYAELTFHYWYWKNLLPKKNDNKWVGICSYRLLWSNKKKITEDSKFEDIVLREIPKEWENFDTIMGEHVYINDLKLSKLIKHGLMSLIRNPAAILKTKRNIRFHFDMWHGNGNLDKAIELLDDNEREDFRKYTLENVSFCRGHMFICRSKKIMNNYFSSVFPWLEKCEKIFGLNPKSGRYEARIYGYLAERYMSYWFSKYTKPLLWPVIFFDIIHEKNKKI